jgi:hypothetical protein
VTGTTTDNEKIRRRTKSIPELWTKTILHDLDRQAGRQSL